MSFPARLYPDQVELALVHSRDNINDKSQTIVDLMGGNQVKNYDMGGMGSNALKDLGLVSVIAGKECFFLSGSRIDHKDVRQTKQDLNVGTNANMAAPQQAVAAVGAGLTEDIRLDLNLLRAVGADIVNMPALMVEIQTIMQNPQNYSFESIQKMDGLLVDIANLRQLSQLGVLPDAEPRIQSMIENIATRIADTTLSLFDTQSISKSMLQFVSGMVVNIVSSAGIESPALDQKISAMEGRLNEDVYLEQSLNAVKESLQLALKNPDITDEQKVRILDVLNAINAHENQNGNILNITQAIAKLSPAIAELLPPIQSQNMAIILSVAVDAIHVKAANDLGVSIDQIRTIDTVMQNIAIAAQDLSQKLELLSPGERELLTQMNATLQSFAQSPLSLAVVADLTKLQSIISPTVQVINGIDVSVENFKNIPPQIIESLIKSVESALPTTVNILAEKWGMAPLDVSLVAMTLAQTVTEFRAELSQTQNNERRHEIMEQMNAIVALQLNSMSIDGSNITIKLLQSSSPLEMELTLHDTQDSIVGKGLDIVPETGIINNSNSIVGNNIISLYSYLPAFQQANLGNYVPNHSAHILTQDNRVSSAPKLSLETGVDGSQIFTKTNSEVNKDSLSINLKSDNSVVESRLRTNENTVLNIATLQNENIKSTEQKRVDGKLGNNTINDQSNSELFRTVEDTRSVQERVRPDNNHERGEEGKGIALYKSCGKDCKCKEMFNAVNGTDAKIRANPESVLDEGKIQVLIDQTGNTATALHTIQQAMDLEITLAKMDVNRMDIAGTDNQTAQNALQRKIEKAFALEDKSHIEDANNDIPDLRKIAEGKFRPTSYGAEVKLNMVEVGTKDNLGSYQGNTKRVRVRSPKI